MPRPLTSVVDRARTSTGRKAVKYTLVSVISVGVSQVAMITAFGLFHWPARWSAVFATSIGAIPSYYLNRRWTWGKTGKSHLWREIVPFWALAFIGLAFSVFTSGLAEGYVEDHERELSHLMETAIVGGAYFAAFAVLWIGKFVVFNKVLFVTRDEDLRDALANEVVG